MKFTIEREQFLGSMTKMQRIVEKKNTLPILNNVLLSAANNSLSLRATDLDVEIADTIAADVSQSGATTVPVHMLYDILRKLPSGAQISVETKDASAIVKSGRSRFSINTLGSEDYPDIAAGDLTSSFTMPAADLLRLIDKTEFAISTEETRYYLNGIYLHVIAVGNTSFLRAVATDGHRLAQSQVTAPAGSAGMPSIIVPRKTILETLKLLERAEDPVTIELSSQKIRFTIGHIILTSKLIDGTYPDYQRVIPTNNPHMLKVDKKEFETAVDRVSIVASDRGRAIKVSVSPGHLVMSVINPDSGNATEEMDVDYNAATLEIGFNSRYLLDIAAQIDAGNAILRFSEPTAPALITSEGDDNTLYVLMPMRV